MRIAETPFYEICTCNWKDDKTNAKM